jgi:hypothetical protein
MLNYLLPVLMIGSVSLSALEVNQLEPGKSLLPGGDDPARSRLFVDGKPGGGSLLRPVGKNAKLELAVLAESADTVRVTVPEGAALPFSGTMNVALDFDSEATPVTASFRIKFENFQSGKGGKNNFSVLLGGAHLQFRGDTRDVRYFDGEQGKYVVLQKLKENEWYSFSIALGAETFDLNEQKNIRQRGKNTRPRFMQWNSLLEQKADGKAPVIQLKEIMVK